MCQLLVLHTCFIVSPLYLSIWDWYDIYYILPWQMNSCFTNLSSWDRFFPDSSDFPDISYISPWQMNSCFTNLRQIFPDSSDFPDIYYITPWQMDSCFTKQISKATNNLSGQNVMYTWEIWKVVEKKIFLTVHYLFVEATKWLVGLSDTVILFVCVLKLLVLYVENTSALCQDY